MFELNANNHEQRRALANAAALGAIMRDGRFVAYEPRPNVATTEYARRYREANIWWATA